jgi:hypothetical protein
MKVFILLISLLLFAGCADNWVAEVESDTEWEVTISSNKTITGSGNKIINVNDNLSNVIQIEAEKKTEDGKLNLRVCNNNGIFAPTESEWIGTNAPYGKLYLRYSK